MVDWRALRRELAESQLIPGPGEAELLKRPNPGCDLAEALDGIARKSEKDSVEIFRDKYVAAVTRFHHRRSAPVLRPASVTWCRYLCGC